MYRHSETQVYQAQASSNNGKQRYAFQRINKNSNGNSTLIAIQGNKNDVYTVVQAVKDKNGQVKKRVYRMGADYIPSLMKANKEELANDLTKVVSLPNKKTNKPAKKVTKKSTTKKLTTKKRAAKKSTTKKSIKKTTKKRTVSKKKKDTGFFASLFS